MDTLTHILAPFIVTNPLRRPDPEPGVAEEKWRERFAILLGALLPDADGIVGLYSLVAYEKHHRVVSHSILGMVFLSGVCTLIARYWPRRLWWPSWRELRGEGQFKPPPWRRLWFLACAGLGLHFAGDWISAWGIWPFWPWVTGQSGDFALGRVNSIEPVILFLTVAAWAIQHWLIQNRGLGAGKIVSCCWITMVVLYVWFRPWFGPAAYV